MPTKMHTFTVTYSCGHKVTYNMYPGIIVQPGDHTICYECNEIREVTSTIDLGETEKQEEL